jgi:hypothetical protein
MVTISFETNIVQSGGIPMDQLFNKEFLITEKEIKKEYLSWLTYDGKFLAGMICKI